MGRVATRKARQRARGKDANAASLVASRDRASQAWEATVHGKAKRDFEFTVAAISKCSEMTSAKAQELLRLVGVSPRKPNVSIRHKLALVAHLQQAPGHSIGTVVMRPIPF